MENYLEEALISLNIEYANKRRSGRLGAVQLNRLPGGFLADWDRQEGQPRRMGNEQYKHRYLLCQPGEDHEFPVDESSLHSRSRGL